jgi:hypothetical protein
VLTVVRRAVTDQLVLGEVVAALGRSSSTHTRGRMTRAMAPVAHARSAFHNERRAQPTSPGSVPDFGG